jgi:hypothetical protein
MPWQVIRHEMMKLIQALSPLLLALAIGCAEEAKPTYVTVAEPANVRGNERAFVGYVLEHLSPTIEKVTCHCCKKTLKQCLGEMGVKSGGCPFT